MPEGDTVWRSARRLNEALAGRVVARCELRWPDLGGVDLAGTTTLAVLPHGKHILHRLDSGLTLHSHLRMEGQWRLDATGTGHAPAERSLPVRAVIWTDEWIAVGLRLGMLDLVPTRDEHLLVGHLGPDILGPDWDLELAVANVVGHPDTIVAALLDQRTLAGVGTFYASEALFLEGRSPWAPASSLDRGAVASLVQRAQRLMRANLAHSMQSTTGLWRRGERSYVHGRLALPCRRCGEPVRVADSSRSVAARSVFYCLACQGGLAPTDSGARQKPLGAGSRGLTQRRRRPPSRVED